jgi:hypothetical protein
LISSWVSSRMVRHQDVADHLVGQHLFFVNG